MRPTIIRYGKAVIMTIGCVAKFSMGSYLTRNVPWQGSFLLVRGSPKGFRGFKTKMFGLPPHEGLEEFNFENTPHRQDRWGSLKWDKYEGKDVIPMWVADMEFPAAPVILEALRDRIEHGVFGYTSPTPGVKGAVVRYLKTRHALTEAKEEWLFFSPGVVQSLTAACAMLPEKSAVMVFTPSYPPFFNTPEYNDREVVTLALDRASGQWNLDWEAMDAAIKDNPNIRLLMLCNPHNPVGKVFSEEELKQVGEFCEEHDLILVADEIHCDLVLDEDVKHTCMLAVDGGRFAKRTILLNAPSKTYNIPGLGCSYAVIPNKELRLAFRKVCRGWITTNPTLGYTACEASYDKGESWRQALLAHLRGNRDFLYHFLETRLPEVKVDPMHATYLAWLDVRELGWKSPGLQFEKYGVGLTDGKTFLGEGFVRLNFACPRAMLEEGLLRIEHAVIEVYREKDAT